MKRTLLPAARHNNADPEMGLILTNIALKPIACDKGAAAILAGKSSSSIRPELPASLPKELLYAIGDRKPTDLPLSKITFQLGNDAYNCRVYLMEKENGVPAMIVLHLDKVCSLLDAVRAVAEKSNLTQREQEVLQGISLGLSSKELADRMKISPNTIKVYVRLIMIKMGVATRGGIVAQILQGQSQQGGRDESSYVASNRS